MVAVEKITPAMFAEIYDAFLKDDDPRSTQDDWKRLFAPADAKEDCYGYALVDGGRIGGILGTLFSSRRIDGKTERFCNLHCWHVSPEYRGNSLMLMRPVLRLADHTITDFTPTPRVCEISKRLGFRELDATVRILLPFASRGREDRHDCRFTSDIAEIANRLSPADRVLLEDHRGGACRHLLAYDGEQYCYIVYSRVQRNWMPYCYIHYLSNKPMFAQRQATLRAMLLRESRAPFIAVDARSIPDIRTPGGFVLPIASRQLYRSSSVEPRQIDGLYSELVLLNLCTFPSLSHHLNRWLGSGRDGRANERATHDVSYSTTEPENAR